MPHKMTIGEMLDELEDMLGQMDDEEENFIEQCLQQEIDAPGTFSADQYMRVQEIYESFFE